MQTAICLFAGVASAVNVDDFGALGDGAAWDHTAIQAAINAAGVGGVVEFSADKTYVQCKHLLPLRGQTIRGNGAVLKRCDAVTAILTEDVAAGTQMLVVDDPSVFEFGQSLTPVKGAGGYADGEFVVSHFLQSVNGDQLTVSTALQQSYPAGSVVAVKFDQLYIQNSSTDVTVEDLVFDGNRANNNVYLAWTDNKAIRGYSGLTVTRSTFRFLPGNAITVFGTNVLIVRNGFHDLDGPIVHLSGNNPVNGSTVTISNNGIRRTNAQAERMQHSEGVITISALNDSIRVIGNTVINAPVPFISRFHAEMRDWIIRGNTVYGTRGIFLAKVWPGNALTDVLWEDNNFFNAGEGRTIRRDGAEFITGFVFRNNQVIGGNLRLDGLLNGEVANNTIKSCKVLPLEITGSTDMAVSGNIEDRQYCPLNVQVMASPGAVDEPGGAITFNVDISNWADPGDTVTSSGISVRTVVESFLGENIGASCSPSLPTVLLAGEALSCSIVREIIGDDDVIVTFAASGKIPNGSPIEGSMAARVRINDVTSPIITLTGASVETIAVGGIYEESGAIASDNRDGNVTELIVIDSASVDTTKPGTYVVTYSVSDAAGNAATAQRRIEVVEPDPEPEPPPQPFPAPPRSGGGAMDMPTLLVLAILLAGARRKPRFRIWLADTASTIEY